MPQPWAVGLGLQMHRLEVPLPSAFTAVGKDFRVLFGLKGQQVCKDVFQVQVRVGGVSLFWQVNGKAGQARKFLRSDKAWAQQQGLFRHDFFVAKDSVSIC